MVVAIT